MEAEPLFYSFNKQNLYFAFEILIIKKDGDCNP